MTSTPDPNRPPLQLPLHGEVVLVTGGAQGIGAGTVREARAQGAAVSFCDVDAARAAATAAALAADGLEVHHAVADVTDAASIAAWVEGATDALGPPSGLVNNAGRNSYAHPATMTEDEWDAFFAIDLKASWLCARAVLAGMEALGGGSIVNVASVHARLTTRGMFPYAAAKAGITGLTRSLALDLADQRIRVNTVSPGLVATPLMEAHFAAAPDDLDAALAVQPFGRAGQAAEIAAVICFLLSSKASFVSGAEWAVDGAYGARFA